MKNLKILSLLFLCVLISFASCKNRKYAYDEGYESAWEGEEPPSSIWSSREKINGYQDGLEDADAYDDGYFDGWNGKKPLYLGDQFYMDGFKDAKKDKKR